MLRMLTAIKFDDKAKGWTIENERVRPGRVLPAKVDAELLIAEPLP